MAIYQSGYSDAQRTNASSRIARTYKDLNLNSRPTDLSPELYYNITSLFEKD